MKAQLNNEKKEQLMQDIEGITLPGDTCCVSELIEQRVQEEVSYRLTDPKAKYSRAIAEPSSNQHFLDDIIAQRRFTGPALVQEMCRRAGIHDLDYSEYEAIRQGRSIRPDASTIRGLIATTSAQYERELRFSVTPTDMAEYLRNKLCSALFSDYRRFLWHGQ